MKDVYKTEFDVIIIGSGLAGSILATILAKHNLQVLTIDKNAHPRFAIGEAMTPDTDLIASGFIDALYSFGLVNSCTIIIPLAQRIMQAIAENDYTPKRFGDIERLQQNLLDYNDNLVNCSYISFTDFKLWDAWRRVWLMGSFMRQAKAGLSKRMKIDAGKSQQLAAIAENDLARLTPSYEGLGDDLFQEATATVEKVGKGLLSPDVAADWLLKAIDRIDFLPRNFWKLGDASQTDVDTESPLFKSEYSRFLSWVKTAEKPEIKKYFDYDMEDLLAAMEQRKAEVARQGLRL